MNDETEVDMDDLLDMELDDLDDLPSFEPYPEGAHRVSVSLEKKSVNEHPTIELAMKAVETLELADHNDTPLEAGAETNVLYMMDNEFGRGKFKEVAPAFVAHVGSSNLKDIVEGVTDVECLVVTTLRKNKKSGDSYTNIKELKVV